MSNYNRTRGNANVNYKAMTEYYDERGILKREVFVDWPKQIADSLSRSGETRTSLRRFYSQLAAVKHQLRMNPSDCKLVRHGVGSLHTFAQYQAGRVIKGETKNFIVANCNTVLSDESKFEGFFQLFQGVMAYLPRNK